MSARPTDNSSSSRPQGDSSGPHRWTREKAQEAGRKGAEVRRQKALREAHRAAQAEAQGGAEEGEGSAPQGRMAESVEVSRATADHRVALVRVPVEVGHIIRKLSTDAQAGDTTAARELRAWMQDFPPDDAAGDASDLAAPQRSRIAALLARLIAEDEKALHSTAFEGGTQDGFDAALARPADDSAVGHPRSDGSHPLARGSRPPTAIHENLSPARDSDLPPHEPLPPDGTGSPLDTQE